MIRTVLASLMAVALIAPPAFARGGGGHGGGRGGGRGGGHSHGGRTVHSGGTHRSGLKQNHGKAHHSVKSSQHRDTVHVNGYTTKNGHHVASHDRTAANTTKNDNWSTKGNVNPETSKPGTKPPDGRKH